MPFSCLSSCCTRASGSREDCARMFQCRKARRQALAPAQSPVSLFENPVKKMCPHRIPHQKTHWEIPKLHNPSSRTPLSSLFHFADDRQPDGTSKILCVLEQLLATFPTDRSPQPPWHVLQESRCVCRFRNRNPTLSCLRIKGQQAYTKTGSFPISKEKTLQNLFPPLPVGMPLACRSIQFPLFFYLPCNMFNLT